MITGKNILVTGGAGFIGSNLTEALLSNNNKVVCLDNFSTGYKHNIEQFLSNPNYTLIEGDIRDFETCQKAVEGIEIIHHHAALGSVPRSIQDPITSTQVNIMGFVNLLTAAKDANVKKVIYASSSSTYGDADYSPKIETKKGNLLSPYAVTKQANDLFAAVFSRTYNIQTIGLCYFNVFGPKQDPNGAYAAVIPKFIAIFMDHKNPIIYGDGTQSRDFTHVSNVIHANMLAAAKEHPNTHEHYNIACGDSISLNDLSAYMQDSLSKYDAEIANCSIEHEGPRKGDILHSLAAINKAQNNFGYEPLMSVKDGIEKTIEWYWNKK